MSRPNFAAIINNAKPKNEYHYSSLDPPHSHLASHIYPLYSQPEARNIKVLKSIHVHLSLEVEQCVPYHNDSMPYFAFMGHTQLANC